MDTDISKENHMWHDDNDDIMKLYNLLEEHEIYNPLPAVCPVCGSQSGHIYLHRYDEEHHGGSWVWCSNCHSYSHASFRVPEWWRNLSLFSILDLHAVPDNLDQKAQYIDDFVNKLLAIHSDKILKETPCDLICEKCGTPMVKELPDDRVGTYGIICPNCDCGSVTTYTDPIVTDQTQYSIVLLEGNESSVEVIRAVNKVSHRNLLKSKQLIESAPQVIYEGDALEVFDMKEILDAEAVLYKIEPDYPYD